MSLDEKKDAKNLLGFKDSVNSEAFNDNNRNFSISVNPIIKKDEEEDEENETHSDIEVNVTTYKIKLVFLGDSNVGKTSIIHRFCENKFEENGLVSTISVAFKNKFLKIDSFTQVNMNIWDTAGQEKFRSMTRSYLRDSHGVFLVFDLSQKKSFDSLNFWLEEINNSDINKQYVKMLIGNKSDFKQKEVDKETAKKFAEENNMKYLEVSAKDGINIESMFEMMGIECVKILEKENKGENDKSNHSRIKNKEEKEEVFKNNSVLSAKEFNNDIKKIKEHSCC